MNNLRKYIIVLIIAIVIVSVGVSVPILLWLSNDTPDEIVIIDATDPTVEITSPTNNTTYNNATQWLSIAATDESGIDMVWYNWNGGNVTYTSPQEITFNEGLNTIDAWAEDLEDNIGSTSISFTIILDPLVEIISPVNDAIYNNATQLLQINATDSIGIDAVWYNWNGSNVTYTSSQEITFNEGFNTIYAWANNSAGNSGSTSVSFIVDTNPFSSVWETNRSGRGGNNQIRLPLESSGTYNFIVNWGDGTNSSITSWNQAERTHTYASEGVYTINITGIINGWCFNHEGELIIKEEKLLEIEQWGDLRLGNSGGYFWGCTYLNITASDSLDLTGTTNFAHAFRACRTLDKPKCMSDWDVSSVTNMYEMFAGAHAFNLNISSWDVSNVTNMKSMFNGAEVFNQDIGDWDVSSVTDMTAMFYAAEDFNQDIGSWDVSSVEHMNYMFDGVTLSTANYDSLLIGWESLPTLQKDVTFDGGNSQYSSAAASARQSLLNMPNNWVITDGGLV